MIKVGVLYSWNPKNYLLFTNTLYPIIKWNKLLYKNGFHIDFYTAVTVKLLDSDIIIVVDFFPFKNLLTNEEMDILSNLGKHGAKVIFFDNRDSCGTTNFEIMGCVDRYCKKQIYKDRSIYYRSVYGLRTYSEFYHAKYGVTDTVNENRVLLKKEHEKKLFVGWNLGLGIYSLNSGLLRRLNYYIYKFGFPIKFMFDKDLIPPVKLEWENRNIDIHYRGRRDYSLETISFARLKVDEQLKAFSENYVIRNNGNVSRKKYSKELIGSKVVISPFGYGEVCHRDFEAMANGCVLFKPSMSHVETWPNYYREYETYVPYSWDFSDFNERLEGILNNTEKSIEIAKLSLELFNSSFLDSGAVRFCNKFKQLCSFDSK